MTLEHVPSRALHRAPELTILAFSVNDTSLISQIFPAIDNLVWEHAMGKRQGSDSGLQPVRSSARHWEP